MEGGRDALERRRTGEVPALDPDFIVGKNELHKRKSPRREVVRSSAGASVVYPPFLGSFA